MPLIRFILFALVVVVVVSAAPAAQARPDPIAEVSALIAQQPDNGSLLLRRAALSRDQDDVESALADLELAASMPASAAEANLRAGHLLFDLGRFAEASARFDAASALQPGDAILRRMKARCLWGMGKRSAAAAVFEALMAEPALPEPDLFRNYAALLADSQPARLGPALAVLDRGMERLGPTPALAEMAVDLELRRRRWDRAIAYLDVVVASVERKDYWLRRKADVLVLAGRTCAARDVYRAAIAAIAALPPDVQRTLMFTTARDELGALAKRHDRPACVFRDKSGLREPL